VNATISSGKISNTVNSTTCGIESSAFSTIARWFASLTTSPATAASPAQEAEE